MLFKKQRQVIKLNQDLCKANLDDNAILFLRVENLVTDKEAILEVPPHHNAILIKGGGGIRYYDSGNYNVFDDKKEIKNWKNGLSVEVVYIPLEAGVRIQWGTPNRVRYRDDASNKVITVGARGECVVNVHNPELFYRRVVGNKKEFNVDEFCERFVETIAGEFADIFLATIKEKNLTYDQFTANKKAIGNRMGEILSHNEFEKKWGLTVEEFRIADFHLEDEDMDAIEDAAAEKQKQEKLKEYLAEVERLDDKQWEREKYLRQLELQDKAAYYEVLKVVGENGGKLKKNAGEETLCPNCNTAYKPGDKFCPVCGKRLTKEPVICPDCGKANPHTAVFCSNCGKKLS